MLDNTLYREDIVRAKNIQGIERLYGKRFLITGATGLIGHLLTDVLMSMPIAKLIAVARDRDKAGMQLGQYFSDSRFQFVAHDVQFPLSTDSTETLDFIIVAAGDAHPVAYSQHPVEIILANFMGVKNTLDLATRYGAELLFVSSGEIYGSNEEHKAFAEGDTGKLNLSEARACYNEAKRVCEALCQSYIAEHGVRAKIVRPCRLFGPTLLSTDSKAASQLIMNALRNEDIVLKSEGDQHYSFCYISDAVKALLLVLLHGTSGQAYNVSAGACRLRDFAEICARACGKEVVYATHSDVERKGISKVQYSELDYSKLQKLGYVPDYTIEQGVCRTLEILRRTTELF